MARRQQEESHRMAHFFVVAVLIAVVLGITSYAPSYQIAPQFTDPPDPLGIEFLACGTGTNGDVDPYVTVSDECGFISFLDMGADPCKSPECGSAFVAKLKAKGKAEAAEKCEVERGSAATYWQCNTEDGACERNVVYEGCEETKARCTQYPTTQLLAHFLTATCRMSVSCHSPGYWQVTCDEKGGDGSLLPGFQTR